MRIVNRKEFLELPSGTVFSKYKPCIFDGLYIKSYSIGTNDFLYQSLIGNIKCSDGVEFSDILFSAVEKQSNIELDFELPERDGLFDDEQLFAIYSKDDVTELVITLLESSR